MSAQTALMTQPTDFGLAGPLGSFDAYVDRVSRVPVLSREEEQRLARLFRDEEDLDAARQLVLSHLRFVVHIARGYGGYGLPLSDLVQEGNVGLMKAVKRFDPTVGVRLVSFAVHWIRAEIHEYVLRNWRLVRIATTKAQRKLFFNLRRAKSGLGWLSQDETHAVARDLGVTPAEVTDMEQRLSARDASFDPLPAGEVEEGYGPAAFLAATLLAFLPDTLAQSGVAYNDVPLAFGLLVSVHALDAAVRQPAPARVALAALACASTACIKYSGVVVMPILFALLALEALSGRWRDAPWRRAVLLAVPVFAAVAYATIALLYLGDWRLADFFGGLQEITRSSMAGRVAFLLGERNVGGWWYYFPVAFALKTPLALHVLMVLALVAAFPAARSGRWREFLTDPARAPAVAAGIFVAALRNFPDRLPPALRLPSQLTAAGPNLFNAAIRRPAPPGSQFDE